MANYTPITDFASKDLLPSGDPAKIARGSEVTDELNAIATAITTKANIAGPTFTGTVTIPTLDGAAIDGGTF
jgi:hypothetical protein